MFKTLFLLCTKHIRDSERVKWYSCHCPYGCMYSGLGGCEWSHVWQRREAISQITAQQVSGCRAEGGVREQQGQLSNLSLQTVIQNIHF